MHNASTDRLSPEDRGLLDEFAMDNRRKYAKSTLDKYVYQLARISIWLHAEGLTFQSASPGKLNQYLYEREEAGISPRSLLDEHKALRALYNWAGAEGEMSTATHRGKSLTMTQVMHKDNVQMPKVKLNSSVKPVTTVQVDMYEAMVAATRVVAPSAYERAVVVRNQAILAVLWWAGVRRDDIAAMNVSDVNMQERTVFIRDQKNDTSRSFPILNRDMYMALSKWLRTRNAMKGVQTEALFISIGRHGRTGRDRMSAEGVGQTVRRIAAAANVKVTTHSFRRGRAEQMVAAGMTDRQIMDLMGWTDYRMPGHYARVNGMTIATEKAIAAFGDDF